MLPLSIPQVSNFEALSNSSSEVHSTIKPQEPTAVTNLNSILAVFASLLYCLQPFSLSLWDHLQNNHPHAKRKLNLQIEKLD